MLIQEEARRSQQAGNKKARFFVDSDDRNGVAPSTWLEVSAALSKMLRRSATVVYVEINSLQRRVSPPTCHAWAMDPVRHFESFQFQKPLTAASELVLNAGLCENHRSGAPMRLN